MGIGAALEEAEGGGRGAAAVGGRQDECSGRPRCGADAEIQDLVFARNQAERNLCDAKRTLALHAMSRTDANEQERIFEMAPVLTVDLILLWAEREACSTSRVQRAKWRLFRRD